MEQEKLLRYGGIGLLGLAGFMILSNSSKASTSGGSKPPPVQPPPSSAPATHTPIAAWLAARRPDVVSALQLHQWENVFGQYLKEAWPDFVSANAGAPFSELEGQWLKTYASTFWMRSDIQAAWFGYPAPKQLASGYFGDSQGKQNVIGEFLIESGAGAILAGR